MLVFRIVATILMGVSCLAPLEEKNTIDTLFGLSWRAFVIVALWVI